ncbi:MAG: stage V sporulation protein T [Clostridiales bacterium]|nr:stage V sporulation protein T [Clostridiales bacterium]
MKATGIVRRIDDLGRVVIPKEIRRTLRIREGEPMEIFTGREGEIVLKKYSPIEELGNLSREYAQAMGQTLGYLVCISDHDQIVAAGGPKQQEYQGKNISKELEEAIRNRVTIYADAKEKSWIPLTAEEKERTGSRIIQPIIAAGDAIGSVIIVNKKDGNGLTDTEKKLVQIAAGFLGRQMEQ